MTDLHSTLAIQESTLCGSGKGGQAPSGNWVKSDGAVDITKLPSLLCRCHKALIWLPFSCYLVAGKMAKVELHNLIHILSLPTTKKPANTSNPSVGPMGRYARIMGNRKRTPHGKQIPPAGYAALPVLP
jgi:hypothetical protein